MSCVCNNKLIVLCTFLVWYTRAPVRNQNLFGMTQDALNSIWLVRALKHLSEPGIVVETLRLNALHDITLFGSFWYW